MHKFRISDSFQYNEEDLKILKGLVMILPVCVVSALSFHVSSAFMPGPIKETHAYNIGLNPVLKQKVNMIQENSDFYQVLYAQIGRVRSNCTMAQNEKVITDKKGVITKSDWNACNGIDLAIKNKYTIHFEMANRLNPNIYVSVGKGDQKRFFSIRNQELKDVIYHNALGRDPMWHNEIQLLNDTSCTLVQYAEKPTYGLIDKEKYQNDLYLLTSVKATAKVACVKDKKIQEFNIPEFTIFNYQM